MTKNSNPSRVEGGGNTIVSMNVARKGSESNSPSGTKSGSRITKHDGGQKKPKQYRVSAWTNQGVSDISSFISPIFVLSSLMLTLVLSNKLDLIVLLWSSHTRMSFEFEFTRNYFRHF